MTTPTNTRPQGGAESARKALIQALDRYLRQDETAGDTDNNVYREGLKAMADALAAPASAQEAPTLSKKDLNKLLNDFARACAFGEDSIARMAASKAIHEYLDAAFSALAATSAHSAAVQQEEEQPSDKQKKLMELADRIDYEELWRRAGMHHDKMTPEQQDRMNAGVALRRYAWLWAPGRWLIFPPVGPVNFSASTLDKVYAMAKKDEGRAALASAQPKTGERSE